MFFLKYTIYIWVVEVINRDHPMPKQTTLTTYSLFSSEMSFQYHFSESIVIITSVFPPPSIKYFKKLFSYTNSWQVVWPIILTDAKFQISGTHGESSFFSSFLSWDRFHCNASVSSFSWQPAPHRIHLSLLSASSVS